MKQVKFVSVLMAMVFLVLGFPAQTWADPCLVVYPTGPVKYHYNVNEYYTVSFGDSLYDSEYDRGGKVLIDINTNKVPLDIYQAQNITRFEPSVNGEEGYFFIGYELDLIIDGWSNTPTTYENILLVFEPNPEGCAVSITVDDVSVEDDTYPCGNLTVSTPTSEGNNYSDTITRHIAWAGCFGVRIWAFADENYNGQKDGGECFTAFSHDITIPVEETSWGAIKALYE